MWYNEIMVNRLILLLSLVAVVVLIVIMNFFAPMDLGPFGVLLFFTMVYAVVFGVCTGLVGIFAKLNGRAKMRRKDYTYAAMIALGPLMLLMVRSFGSFNYGTVALVAVCVGLGCFVVSKLM